MAKKVKTQSSKKRYFVSVLVGIAFFLGSSYFLKAQSPCANSRTCKSDLSVSVDNNAVGVFQGQKVTPPKIDLAFERFKPKSTVLGASVAKGEKHIYVNLATQTLYAYQGKTQVMKAIISSGKWGRTPVGNFHVWTKIRSTRMAGGQGADAYDLPNVPYVMYFFNDFGFHGAYWHNNFGHPMSHGCVNMRIVDAQSLYNWADGPIKDSKGTAVSVCNKFIAPNTCVQENPVN